MKAPPRKCALCRRPGHRRNHCPELPDGKRRPPRRPEACGYCHRTDGTHSAKCKRKPSPASSSSPNGAVGALRAELAKYESKAQALRTAIEVLEGV